ncbi:hypothetical protein O9929_27500 [Vibrio lentus]|nr:hypothetical protein [Vibrio lentus]
MNCTTKEDCDSKATMYPPSPVHTVTTEDFASRAPEAYDYFTSTCGFTNDKMNYFLLDGRQPSGW